MQRRLPRRAAPWIALGLTACASLTPAQRDGVAKFGKAASRAARLPGEALEAFFALHQSVAQLKASTAVIRGPDDAALAFSVLQRGIALQAALRPSALRLQKAMALIDTYANALSVLVQDDGEALDRDALALGGSIDGALAAYQGFALDDLHDKLLAEDVHAQIELIHADAQSLQQVVASLHGASAHLQSVIDAVNTVAQVIGAVAQIGKLAATIG